MQGEISLRMRLSRAFCAGLIEACTPRISNHQPAPSYPVLFARASLKRRRDRAGAAGAARYPVLFARASLKQNIRILLQSQMGELSRAFCAGLIEAQQRRRDLPQEQGYPVLFARASLKHVSEVDRVANTLAGYPVLFARASLKRIEQTSAALGALGYPVLFARASLKPALRIGVRPQNDLLSRAFCAGLIEAQPGNSLPWLMLECYPVLFARASLKLVPEISGSEHEVQLSRAFCAGLIEARAIACCLTNLAMTLSRAFCAGLIEALLFLPVNAKRYWLSRAFCAGLIEACAS